MEDPIQRVLSNDLILDNIFRHLPTPDLLLKVNRTAPKWNKAVSKFVQLKRTIELTTKNLLAYSEFINDGGVEAKFIDLKLLYYHYARGLNQEDVGKILSALTKFGENVRNIRFQASCWEIRNNLGEHLQANLLREILRRCKNVKNITLDFVSSGTSNPDIYKLLDLENLDKLFQLNTLSISLNQFCHRILHSFLKAAPNIQSFEPINSMKLQDLRRAESEFPKILEKLEFFITPSGFDEPLANFFIDKKFSSLNNLQFGVNGDFQRIDKILGKYADQLLHLRLFLSGDRNTSRLERPQLFLPLMKNLETLTLDFDALERLSTNFAVCRFVRKAADERNFPKLQTVIMDFPYEFTDRDFDGKSQAEKLFEQVCLATFKYRPAHPVFPNVKRIIVKSGEDYFYGQDSLKIKPRVLKAIRWYFPNFVYDYRNFCCEN